MATIKLNLSRLLGFRLLDKDGAAGSRRLGNKLGDKLGSKPGIKTGAKLGVKVGEKVPTADAT